MAVFHYPMELAPTPQGPFQPLRAVVDTGAFYTWVPRSILEGLGITPDSRRQFQLADGRVIEREVAEAVVRIDGQVRHTTVVLSDEETEPLLGAVTLEQFGLAAEPVNARLVPMPRLFLMGSR